MYIKAYLEINMLMYTATEWIVSFQIDMLTLWLTGRLYMETVLLWQLLRSNDITRWSLNTMALMSLWEKEVNLRDFSLSIFHREETMWRHHKKYGYMPVRKWVDIQSRCYPALLFIKNRSLFTVIEFGKTKFLVCDVSYYTIASHVGEPLLANYL